LGVNALLGGVLTEDNDKIPGGHPVVVISYSYWQRRFARDPAVIGKSVVVNGHPFTGIGVTPPNFFGVPVGGAPALRARAMMYEQFNPGRSIEQYLDSPLSFALARLKPEVAEQQARAVLTRILQQSLEATGGSQLSPERRQALRQQSVALRP